MRAAATAEGWPASGPPAVMESRAGGRGPRPVTTAAAVVAAARPELVGRRFLAVTASVQPRMSKLYEWDWRAGWIRSSNTKDSADPELQVTLGKLRLA